MRLRHFLRGFSLIELMVTLIIISILAMIAVPSYQHYIKRARFIEIISLVDFFKTAVHFALEEGIPLSQIENGAYGIPDAPPVTKNLASLIVKNGVIIATATDLIEKASYILKPNADGSAWTISGTCIKLGFCRD